MQIMKALLIRTGDVAVFFFFLIEVEKIREVEKNQELFFFSIAELQTYETSIFNIVIIVLR